MLISSYENIDGYSIKKCDPATGILYITEDNPSFISGHVRMRGRNEGKYPFNYIEMIDAIFGYERNTIEVCSRSVPGGNRGGHCFTVDINPDCKPDLVTDGQTLEGIADNEFDRWRCDPPYNQNTALEMYRTELPNTAKLLQAGARVCEEGALMFLLLGPTNYQSCPRGVSRIGCVIISVVPNNEWRTLNIFMKTGNLEAVTLSQKLLKNRKRMRYNNNNCLTSYF